MRCLLHIVINGNGNSETDLQLLNALQKICLSEKVLIVPNQMSESLLSSKKSFGSGSNFCDKGKSKSNLTTARKTPSHRILPQLSSSAKETFNISKKVMDTNTKVGDY